MKFNFIIGGLILLLAGRSAVGADTTSEISDVLKRHYVDRETLDAQKLNDASVAGILKIFGTGAKLLTADEAQSSDVLVLQPNVLTMEPLARVEIIQPDIGYIRLTDVVNETPLALDAELKKFALAKVTGYVLDLRFADGTNITAAAAVASRFLPANMELFTLKHSDGEPQVYRTTLASQSLAIELAKTPLLLLVNAQTRGSAEVLVGALRTQDRGIVIGGPTAGLPVAWQDHALSDGRVLRLASAKIIFPKGGEIFPAGITPDILIKIDPKTEREAVFNVASNITLTASLQPQLTKHAYSEAALVKVFRGEVIDTPTLALTNATASSTNALTLAAAGAPSITGAVSAAVPTRDVVLQRAVDVLKGIRVFLSWQ